ncbi:inactive TPR repeat-containing thioredoxin TTL3-like [Malania oleifera]|uniref:inactive TPR repeat-containing thioredoxin TTL3-like n=1 Tax=Malania oleifera TaxID=397392 RepID=UPI0025AE5009|nr:inactive TPR repeat-containing thioredoxin TTL3-like [Malania oleifera]
MAEMAGDPSEKRSGCGILGAVFGRRGFWLRRTTSSASLPPMNNNNSNKNNVPKVPSSPNSKRWRGNSNETAFANSQNQSDAPPKPVDRPITKAAPPCSVKPVPVYQQNQGRRSTRDQETAMVTSSVQRASQNQGYGQMRKVPKEAIGISGELESMIADHQKAKGSSNLVRASSSNVMLLGNLGNLRQPGTGNSASNDIMDFFPRTAREEPSMPNGKYANSVMGNIVKQAAQSNDYVSKEQPASLCRALSTRMDPETLKIMGNEDYKNGRFAEALALYDAAISIDPNKASYRSNKSAALTALGRLLEAVFECREAIRIDPYYHRAHQRLGTLYLRLGEAEKAIYHYKHAGPEADPDGIGKAQKLQAHLNRCTDAKKQRDWNSLIRESSHALTAGADSAPQIFALQAEALLRLRRHEDADAALTKGPNFDVDECTKFFGPIGNTTLLLVRAQVDMAAGRFDDALAAAQRAARLDSNNKEVNGVVRRARAVAAARSNGNELFKASRFSEACVAYGEGLDHDPYNSVLLCNRAACRSKLGQFEKAAEDCTAALNVRPSYSKARLRRADCNAKLERWEASVQDYEVLVRESPGDEDVGRALSEAQKQLKKQRGGDWKEQDAGNYGGGEELAVVSSADQFRHFVTLPGMSVVLFCNKPGDRATLQFLEQLRKRNPSINFLKVEVEELPQLAKSEGVSSTPAFKMYKNGSRVKEIPGNSHELLESSIKYYSAT